MSDTQIWTIGRVLDWTRGFFERKGFDSPRLDAELLIGHALTLERIGLYLQHHKPLAPEELKSIRELVARRGTHEPIHYILGYREFWSLALKVDRRVLIPRPDTEKVVEVALQSIGETPVTILDLCCGSGAIGLAIASEKPQAQVLCTDISSDALAVAVANRDAHGLDSVTFMQSNLFEDIQGQFDMIVSNPPYIRHADIQNLMTDVADFEPSSALDGGEDGLDFYRKIIESAPLHLNPNGLLIFEIGHDQANDLSALIDKSPELTWCSCVQDLAGRDRVVSVRKNH